MYDSNSLLITVIAAFIAGALNAIAGGGTFIMLPALIAVGYSPITANATSTLVLFPAYIASTWRYRQHFVTNSNLRFADIFWASLSGGIIGAFLLVKTDHAYFQQILPWLLLFATILFIISPVFTKYITYNSYHSQRALVAIGIFTTTIYGGYFNGGIGIILLAVLSLLGHIEINYINAIKNFISLILTAICVIIYYIGDLLILTDVAVMILASVLGGYCGAHYGQKLPSAYMRLLVSIIGIILTIYFFYRYGIV